MNNREIQLLQLGFEKNEHQESFCLSKYDSTWYVDFWKLTDYNPIKWGMYIKTIINDLRLAKKQYYEDLKVSDGYNFAQKEIKKQLLDKLNHLRSDYQQQTQSKLDKSPNYKRETELLAKIDLLKELLK